MKSLNWREVVRGLSPMAVRGSPLGLVSTRSSRETATIRGMAHSPEITSVPSVGTAGIAIVYFVLGYFRHTFRLVSQRRGLGRIIRTLRGG